MSWFNDFIGRLSSATEPRPQKLANFIGRPTVESVLAELSGGAVPMDVSFDRCVSDVFEVEDEQDDVIVLVLHWSYQNTAQERRTYTTIAITMRYDR